ncbi:MAG TPA: lysylphosphatidylglycerol synthase domain-containing protein [Thermoleophilaceae bacterium]
MIPGQPSTGRRRTAITVLASMLASAVLIAALVSKWGELKAGITGAPLLIVIVATLLQILALVSRSEAWHVSVRASGGTVSRRRLYRASSMGCVGNLLNSQLGAAARIATLRRSAPAECPKVPSLVAAELPILVVEAALAAATSFTLIGPLGLPWWLPLAALAVVGAICVAVRGVAVNRARWLRTGLSVMGTARGRSLLVAFVLVAIFSQIARNWLMLHAVGMDVSIFDAVAVLIAVVTLGQLPFGLSVGAAASVLILGPHGVGAAAAAGVLLTATGTVGGLCFAAWAGADVLGEKRLRTLAARLRPPLATPWAKLAALPSQQRSLVERAYFGGLSHLQIVRTLNVAPAAA